MKNLDEIKFKEGLRSHAGMSVPENFFQDFQNRLMAEIANLQELSEKKPEPKIVVCPDRQPEIGKHRYRWISIAACAILVVGIGFFAMNLDQDAVNPNTISQVPAGQEIASVTTESAEEEADTYDMLYASMSDMELYDFYCENF